MVAPPHSRLRRGELAGLKWANVDLEGAVLRVVETRVVIAGKATPSTPKTAAGIRTIPLDEALAAELTSHWARQSADRLPAGEAWEDTDYLFVDGLGRPWRPERISRTFLRLTAAAGLRRIRLHDTRHTVASLILADGVPAKVVQEMLGHEDVTITLAL